jgi:hypothetical protein
MLGNFIVRNYEYINGAPLLSSYFYNKIKGNSIHTVNYFLGLDQRDNSVINSALFDLVFSNISDLSAFISSSPVVTPGKYHPPLLNLNLTFDCHRISLTSHGSYGVN